MFQNILSRLSIVSGVGVISYYVGKKCERQQLLEEIKAINENDPYLINYSQKLLQGIQEKPGLPVFATVSAAVPMTTGDLEVINKPGRVAQIMKYGFPGLDNVRSFDNYVLSYDRRMRVPHWVFEHITQDSVKYNEAVDRSKCDFMPDESIHYYFRSSNSDYKGSGFDRGHMAAAGNHKAQQKFVEQTFFLSNIAPQVGAGFNRHSWNRLESYVRKLTKIYPNVYVCTGPLYLPRKKSDGNFYVEYQVIGSNTVAVPTHFFKIVVGETANNKLEMEAYVMPNKVIDDKTPLTSFQVPPETIERAAGLLFLTNVSKTNLVKINGKKC